MAVATTRTYPNLDAFLRSNPDVTVNQLAQELDCLPSTISMIRWKHRQPRLALALRMAARCRIPLESLLRQTPKANAARS